MKITYDYPTDGSYNETVATTDAGRQFIVCPQYEAVYPINVTHAENCDQINKMGGLCNCGHLENIDIRLLIDDAATNGKFGYAPVTPQKSISDSPRVEQNIDPVKEKEYDDIYNEGCDGYNPYRR